VAEEQSRDFKISRRRAEESRAESGEVSAQGSFKFTDCNFSVAELALRTFSPDPPCSFLRFRLLGLDLLETNFKEFIPFVLTSLPKRLRRP
jgi:hypothetical protein